MQYLEFSEGPTARFFEFTRSFKTRPNDDFTHLADYLAEWLEHGDGVTETGRNFETWLKTALYAANAVMRDPEILEYQPASQSVLSTEQQAAMSASETADYYASGRPQPRQIDGIFDPESSSSMIFDRHYYEYRAELRDHPLGHTPAGQPPRGESPDQA